MTSLRRFLKIGLVVASPFVLAPVVGEFFIKLLEEQGAYEQPSARLGAAMTWLLSVAGLPGFKFVAGLVLGLALGMWLDALLRKLERPPFTYQLMNHDGLWRLAIINKGPEAIFKATIQVLVIRGQWQGQIASLFDATWGINSDARGEATIGFGQSRDIYLATLERGDHGGQVFLWSCSPDGVFSGVSSLPWALPSEAPQGRLDLDVFCSRKREPRRVVLSYDAEGLKVISSEVPEHRPS